MRPERNLRPTKRAGVAGTMWRAVGLRQLLSCSAHVLHRPVESASSIRHSVTTKPTTSDILRLPLTNQRSAYPAASFFFSFAILVDTPAFGFAASACSYAPMASAVRPNISKASPFARSPMDR